MLTELLFGLDTESAGEVQRPKAELGLRMAIFGGLLLVALLGRH